MALACKMCVLSPSRGRGQAAGAEPGALESSLGFWHSADLKASEAMLGCLWDVGRSSVHALPQINPGVHLLMGV